MSQNQFCKTCQFWQQAFKRDKMFGLCDHPLIEDKLVIDSEHNPDRDTTVVHTHEHFGCIYHTPVHGNIATKLPS